MSYPSQIHLTNGADFLNKLKMLTSKSIDAEIIFTLNITYFIS